MNTLKEFLRKPFPQEEDFAELLRIVLTISVFIVLFLYIFQPFGLHRLESSIFLHSLGYGAVTIVVCICFEGLVRFLGIKGDGVSFTFGHWLIYMIGLMLCLSLGNFLYVRLLYHGDMNWAVFPYMVRGTFAIGLFPAIALSTLALLRSERKYEDIAKTLNQIQTKAPHSTHTQDNSERLFDISINRIRYIESMQNYVNIVYLDDDSTAQEQLERATLKGINDALQSTDLSRCHRSFIVNRTAVTNVEGNAQGLLLTLSGIETKVPVSRRFVSSFRGA